MPLLLIVLLTTALFSGCINIDINGANNTQNNTSNDLNISDSNANSTQNDTIGDTAAGGKEQISVAAFNIQIFGVTKAEKEDVMDVLAKTIRRYDIVGIQEIRDASGTALPKLVDLINSGTDENGQPYNYDYVVSDRLGRTSSKEQYAYIYNANTVFVASEPLVYPKPDGTDPFEREPYMVTFQSKTDTFNAVFILIHTKPEDAKNEIDHLDDVVKYAKSIYAGQENYVLMGDFNADGSYFNKSGPSKLKSDDYIWIIGNDVVTTTKTKYTYDRIVITPSLQPYFTSQSGVFNYSAEYGLNATQTYAVSDHYPVYIDFWTVIGDWGRLLFRHIS